MKVALLFYSYHIEYTTNNNIEFQQRYLNSVYVEDLFRSKLAQIVNKLELNIKIISICTNQESYPLGLCTLIVLYANCLDKTS
jgi:hypothetical protein